MGSQRVPPSSWGGPCGVLRNVRMQRASGAFGSMSASVSAHVDQNFADLVEFRRLVEEMIGAAFAARSAIVVRGVVGDDDDRLGPAHTGRAHELQQAKAAAAP